MIKVEHNIETNEIVEREMTAEELTQYEADLAAIEEAKALEAAERATKEAAKLSAKTKLAALGLTDEEVAALLS